VFRRQIEQAQIGGPLHPGSIAPICKRVAQWIGLPERSIDRVSGHSTRMGTSRKLLASNMQELPKSRIEVECRACHRKWQRTEVREAARSRASGPPLPGEGRSPNGAAG
jgi:hypothetical protein